ncbi:MAG: type II secretion system F family protein [Gammaproteobacteria bacterium]|nr:type II secretion system F family protein [Gammaproteobacteria bacterium]
MLSFKYKAIDEAGEVSRGQMEAQDENDLDYRLRKSNLDLISCKAVKSYSFSILPNKVSRRDLITFCFHVEQQISAGIPLLEGLNDLRDGLENRSLQEIIGSVIESIENGASFSEALGQYPEVFDEVFVSLVMSGEKSGNLPEIMVTLSDTLKWQDETINQAKKAFIYPMFVAASVLAVVAALMVFLVPELVKFISSMDQELPAHTKALIFVSDMLREYGYFIAIFIVVCAFLFRYSMHVSDRFKYFVDKIKLNIWFFGPVYRKLVLCRFANNFALLYASGITVLDCLKVSEDIVGNRVLSDAIRIAKKSISNGESISNSFSNTGIFPRLVVRMLSIGETTGALDHSLRNVSYFYNRDVKESMDKLQTMIGPATTVVLGLILGWVILSVLGPIYNSLTAVTF